MKKYAAPVPADTYEAPAVTVAGDARTLTQGGYYNDYDSPGVRKTKNNITRRQPARKRD